MYKKGRVFLKELGSLSLGTNPISPRYLLSILLHLGGHGRTCVHRGASGLGPSFKIGNKAPLSFNLGTLLTRNRRYAVRVGGLRAFRLINTLFSILKEEPSPESPLYPQVRP